MPGGKGEQEVQDDLVVWRWQQTLENRYRTLPRLSEMARNMAKVLQLPGVDLHNRVLPISSSPKHFREIGGLYLGQRWGLVGTWKEVSVCRGRTPRQRKWPFVQFLDSSAADGMQNTQQVIECCLPDSELEFMKKVDNEHRCKVKDAPEALHKCVLRSVRYCFEEIEMAHTRVGTHDFAASTCSTAALFTANPFSKMNFRTSSIFSGHLWSNVLNRRFSNRCFMSWIVPIAQILVFSTKQRGHGKFPSERIDDRSTLEIG
jgi:hypothetical protein